jgi:transcriptional regulator with PAS, ATPase and Fis domain
VLFRSALPESLLESELFGHEKGAFTGASQRRIGRFEEADGGSLFLDEIGELSQAVQVKLLRFLQCREFQRIGDNRMRQSDVRVISATNRDLAARIREGAFREDLFYRLNVVAITIPPLRERKEDISPLMDHFLRRYSTQNGKAIEGFLPEARDLLLKYDYPGNVRELENIIERAVVIARGTLLSTKDLPFPAGDLYPGQDQKKRQTSLKDSVEDLECDMIREAMDKTGNHQTQAAEILGISERTLRYKLKKYGLK